MSDDSGTPEVLTNACDYGRYGLSIFPTLIDDGHPDNKAPMPGYGWLALATSKVNEIVEDFTRAIELWGEERVGIGWALGLDGFVAIDLDVPHQDWPQWAVDISGGAALNITKRGTHLIFHNPPGLEPGNTDTKFPTAGWGEVRGKHGYIIIAGPDRPGLGLAEFDHCMAFPNPEWLEAYGGGAEAVTIAEVVEFAAAHNSASSPNKINGVKVACDSWDPTLAGHPAKGRHPFAVWMMTTVAEESLAGYYPFAEGLQIVKKWWRTVTPPERHKREWNGIVTWAVGRAQQKAGSATPLDPPTDDSTGQDTTEALDLDRITGTVEPLDLIGRWRADRTTKEWLVEHFLPARRSISLTADAKAGKSELTLYVTACLAQGIDPWTRQPRDPVRVAYFDYEMTEDDVFERLESFGFTADDDWSHLSYFLLPPILPLDTTSGAAQFLGAVDAVSPSLVVIDTLMRTVQGDENDAKTFADFYRLVGLGLKQRQATILRLDHYGKDRSKGTRGSTAKDADVDVIWGMTRTGRYSAKLSSRSRVSWVPETWFVERYANPHVNFMPRDQIVNSIPTQPVHELLVALDLLGVPPTWGRDKARQALADAGYTARNEELSAALKLRKERGPLLTVVDGDLSQGSGTGIPVQDLLDD